MAMSKAGYSLLPDISWLKNHLLYLQHLCIRIRFQRFFFICFLLDALWGTSFLVLIFESKFYKVVLLLSISPMQVKEQLGKEAELYTQLPNGRVKCTACARLCEIPEGRVGLCGIRGVTNNKLQLFVYGRIIAGHIDPIEKKPVTHYQPNTAIFSIATTGCNWLCKYCQNYDISQRRKIEGVEMSLTKKISLTFLSQMVMTRLNR